MNTEIMSNVDEYDGIKREVVYYEKRGDRYIGNFALPKIELNRIRKIWNCQNDDPMIFVFPIRTPEQISFFEEILNCDLDTETYDYFLETA